MSDGANFSPFPPLVNLWPLIYSELNLYILVLLLDSLSHSHKHSWLFCVAYNSVQWHMLLLSQHKSCEESMGTCCRTQMCVVELMVLLHTCGNEMGSFTFTPWYPYEVRIGVKDIIVKIILWSFFIYYKASGVYWKSDYWNFFVCLHPGVSPSTADSQVLGESERSREQILQTLSDLSRGFQDIADRCLLVLHLEVRYEKETGEWESLLTCFI